jgi:hypothetical protein
MVAQWVIIRLVKATVVYLTESFAAHDLREESVVSLVHGISTAAMA